MATLKANSVVRSAPSPTPSANGSKRKRTDEVYSQPQDEGEVQHVYTQLTYAIEYLKNDPEKWVSFNDIMSYLNIKDGDHHLRSQLLQLFRMDTQGQRIEYNRKTDMYRYKPKYDIRNPEQLKGFLQSQKSAQGLPVKDLKDGWPKVHEGLRLLEAQNKVLVKRNPKDQQAKTVWDNDPTLMFTVDPDFKQEWHTIQIPASQDDLRKNLVAAGLKPSSVPRAANTTKEAPKRKKPKKPTGKITNAHMANILKDFSHMRK